MTLEEKIKKAEIERILIVDDTSENLKAAEQYFTSLEDYGIKTDYASSAKEAKEMIQKAYNGQEKYSLIISDLQMEEKRSGLEAIREGFKHEAFGFITTGINYDRDESHGHGPTTQVEPHLGSINGRKDKPSVWEIAFEKIINYLTGEGKEITEAIKRHRKFAGKPSEGIADLMMTQYGELK